MKSIDLILLNTPKSTFLRQSYDPKAIEYWRYVGKELCRSTIMDYMDYGLPDDCYGDLIHVNYKGAEIFSRHLARRIETIQRFDVPQLR